MPPKKPAEVGKQPAKVNEIQFIMFRMKFKIPFLRMSVNSKYIWKLSMREDTTLKLNMNGSLFQEIQSIFRSLILVSSEIGLSFK
jgi:hypothetical protein